MEMLESNWRTWCSEKDQAIPDNVDIKAMVEGVLEETGFKEQRAAKMSVDDLLNLLSAFHDVGIHFA